MQISNFPPSLEESEKVCGTWDCHSHTAAVGWSLEWYLLGHRSCLASVCLVTGAVSREGPCTGVVREADFWTDSAKWALHTSNGIQPQWDLGRFASLVWRTGCYSSLPTDSGPAAGPSYLFLSVCPEDSWMRLLHKTLLLPMSWSKWHSKGGVQRSPSFTSVRQRPLGEETEKHG